MAHDPVPWLMPRILFVKERTCAIGPQMGPDGNPNRQQVWSSAKPVERADWWLAPLYLYASGQILVLIGELQQVAPQSREAFRSGHLSEP
jgi:hypothetical protein